MKIQLKRSNVLENNAAKEPTAPQMEYGELAVNYNTDDPAIFIKDSNNNIIRIAGVNNISDDGQVEIPANPNPPSDPLAGNLWYNPVDGRLYIYYVDDNSSQWVDASPDSWQPTVIPNPENPTSQPDTLDDRYVMVTGDNMTGDLTLGTDKITLNAADGSALFKGNVKTENNGVFWYHSPDAPAATATAWQSSATSGGVQKITSVQYSNGSMVIGGDLDQGVGSNSPNILLVEDGSATFASDVKIGGTLPSAPNISLNATDGSASFAGTITSGDAVDASSSWTGGGVTIYDAGVIYAGRSGAGNVFVARQSGTPTSTCSISADGSAFFANNIQVYGDPQTGAGAGLYGGVLSLRIGNATTSAIQVTDDVTSVNTFQVRGDGEISTVSGLTVKDAGGTTNQVEITNNGEGLFKGVLKSETYIISEPNGSAIGIYNYGTNSSDPRAYYQLSQAGANTITFNWDGSASFSGEVAAIIVPPSDARFKENITPAKPQLADVVALGGILKNYDWNDQAPLNEELRSVRQLGLVAQEVEDICPSLVKDINRTKTVEVKPAVMGPKGKVIKEAVTSEVDDSYKGLSQEALIMKLIGAVAELSAEVQALKDAA